MSSTAALSAPAQSALRPEAVVPSPISLVRVAKYPTDRSFGISLEQRRGVSPLDYMAVVSYIFPNSPAARAGVQRGWVLRSINNQSVRGMQVKDVALLFRYHLEIDIEFEIRSYDASAQVVPPTANLNPSANVVNENGASSEHWAGSGFVGSSIPHQQSSPALPVSPPAFLLAALSSGPLLLSPLLAPPIATNGTASFTPGRVISSPGSSLGVAAPTTAVSTPAPARPRTLAAPALPTLNGSQSQAPVEHVNGESNPQQAQAKPTTPTIIHPAPLPPATVHTAQTASSVAAPDAAPTTAAVDRTSPVHPLAQQQLATISSDSDSKLDGAKMSSAKAEIATASSAKPVRAPQASVRSPAPVRAAPSGKQSVVSPQEATAATQEQSAAPPAQAEVIPRPKVEPVVASPTQPPSVGASQASSNIKPPAISIASPSTDTARPSHSGKKRARPRGLSASSASSSDERIAKTLSHGGTITPRNRNTIADESEEDSDHPGARRAVDSIQPRWSPQHDPPTPTSTASRRNARRRNSGSGGDSTRRSRNSLTADRLVSMGFTREDANASVLACGDNPDKCMVWIVSHLEEKQFLSDLNQASIESELSKRAEEKELKAQEHETMKKAKAFTALFTTSYMLSADSSATKLKAMLSDAIGNVDPDSLLRVMLTKLLKLEAQAIRWYKEASKCYLLQVAERLEASFGAHDVLQCCSKARNAATSSCVFVAMLHDEERHLSKALFDMPENHGGVPVVFLKADKDMQFSLDDDGFEVVELDLTGDD